MMHHRDQTLCRQNLPINRSTNFHLALTYLLSHIMLGEVYPPPTPYRRMRTRPPGLQVCPRSTTLLSAEGRFRTVERAQVGKGSSSYMNYTLRTLGGKGGETRLNVTLSVLWWWEGVVKCYITHTVIYFKLL